MLQIDGYSPQASQKCLFLATPTRPYTFCLCTTKQSIEEVNAVNMHAVHVCYVLQLFYTLIHACTILLRQKDTLINEGPGTIVDLIFSRFLAVLRGLL